MLFRPSFCANCGEKIERVEWKIWTSRRFCVVCESEYKGQDLIPRAIVGVGVLIGIFGFGSYLNRGTAITDAQSLRQSRNIGEPTRPPVQVASANTVQSQTGNQDAKPVMPEGQAPVSTSKSLSSLQASTQMAKAKTETAGPAYFCGAATKKGAPCSRRVKGNIRCFQHIGMPAMVSADKLKIN